MMSFRGGRLGDFSIPMSAAWLMNDISEAKGRQEIHTRQAPQVLKALREMALIQSSESSNRIEGVTVDAARLRPLVLGSAKPRSRPEEEVQNYRRALNRIHTGSQHLQVTPDTLRSLHATIQDGAGDAGEWKKRDNEITEVRPGRPPVVRFRPVSAARTPAAVAELCRSYRHAIDQEKVQPLIAISGLVLDFLCIHPFRDGNGRAARLLTLLALYHHGYEAGRYVGLERLVEETKDGYYDSLRASSQGWHDGRHDILPWTNYFLAIVRRAYVEFEKRAGDVRSPRGAKTALVAAAVEGLARDFTLADIEHVCPGVSRDMVRRVLRDLQRGGKIECIGRGPGARWRKRG